MGIERAMVVGLPGRQDRVLLGRKRCQKGIQVPSNDSREVCVMSASCRSWVVRYRFSVKGGDLTKRIRKSAMAHDETRRDRNAAAGALQEVFARDVTVAIASGAGCATAQPAPNE